MISPKCLSQDRSEFLFFTTCRMDISPDVPEELDPPESAAARELVAVLAVSKINGIHNYVVSPSPSPPQAPKN